MTVIISRDRNGSAERAGLEDGLAALFAEREGAAVLMTPHLYHAAEDDVIWATLAGVAGPVAAFSWLHPRPFEWLLRRHGVGRDGLTTFGLRAYAGAEECFRASGMAAAAGKAGTLTRLAASVGKRWYPVVDDSRCVKCGQCAQFCLFGVYEVAGAGGVRVAKPDSCKPGCPACSRICPAGAIMFPLYERDEAIAGAPGKFMRPDAESKTLFEKRTKRTYRAGARTEDDLDTLIDDLDRLQRGKG